MYRPTVLRLAPALLIFLSFLFTTACSKEDAAPATGLIRGQLMPSGAASSVTATGPDGQTVAVVPDASTGAFAFSGLAPGVYQLGAVPTTRYNVPAAVPVTVKAGATTPATLAFSRDNRIRGTMTWEQNGTTYSATIFYGQISAGFFSLEGNTPAGPGGITHAVNFVLTSFAGPGHVAPFAGPGTYSVGASEYPWAGCFYRFPGAFDQYVTSFAARPVGQVMVSRFDLTAGTAAGSFAFVAAPHINNSGSGTTEQVVTNGHFDITF